ncbi:MAG: FxsA family protein [Actinomycetes bacterium]
MVVIALIVIPLAELFVIIQVGGLIGAIPTILLLLTFSIAGAWLVKREGSAAWERFSNAIQAGRVPAKETADGAILLVAGALLITPGFLTDTFGILLLLPPVRAFVRTFASARFIRGSWVGMTVGGAASAGNAWQSRRGRTPDGDSQQPAPRQAYDVDGTATDMDQPQISD